MAIKSNLNVNVGDTETELISSTETNTLEERIFRIGNGDKEISVTTWGSNPGMDWEEIKTKTIIANGYDTIKLDVNHFFNCKLTGNTTSSGEVSIVDAFFNYLTS